MEKEGLLLFAISGTTESLYCAKLYHFLEQCYRFLTLSHLIRQHLYGEWKINNKLSLSSIKGVHLSLILTNFIFIRTETKGEYDYFMKEILSAKHHR